MPSSCLSLESLPTSEVYESMMSTSDFEWPSPSTSES